MITQDSPRLRCARPVSSSPFVVPSAHVLFLLIAALLYGPKSSACAQAANSSSATANVIETQGAPTQEEHDIDKSHMLVIFKALKAYEKDHGKLPDWLSDLLPKYIADSNILVSPYFLRTGKQELYGNEDPRATNSYIYEFSAKPVPKVIRSAFPDLPAGVTMQQWKIKQVAEFGPVVPILRCFIYNPVLNVTSDGEFFESTAYWETDPKTSELRKKRLMNPAKDPGKS